MKDGKVKQALPGSFSPQMPPTHSGAVLAGDGLGPCSAGEVFRWLEATSCPSYLLISPKPSGRSSGRWHLPKHGSKLGIITLKVVASPGVHQSICAAVRAWFVILLIENATVAEQ